MKKINSDIVYNIVKKYSKKPKKDWSDIIALESKKLFSNVDDETLEELYKSTAHKWLVYPEIKRRDIKIHKPPTLNQLSLF